MPDLISDISLLLDRRAPALLREHSIPGMQVAVGIRTRIEIERAYVYSETVSGREMRPDTIFKAASLAKPITTLLALRLVQAGLLELDAPYTRFARSWRLPEPRRAGFDDERVTIRRLLSHNSGLSTPKFPQLPITTPAPSAAAILDGALGPAFTPRLIHEPGTHQEYSAAGYELLRVLIEDVTGQPISAAAHKWVFEPLDLSSTRLGYQSGAPDTATHYDNDGAPIPETFYPAVGSSGLYTTAGDLARLWLAAAGSPPSFLPPDLRHEMLSPQSRANDGFAFGFGFSLAECDGRTLFKHAGWTQGLWAIGEGGLSPDGPHAVALFCNIEKAKEPTLPLIRRITRRLISASEPMQEGSRRLKVSPRILDLQPPRSTP